MNFLSLFSGIGGLDLGLERAGMKCVAQVEIDPFCRKVLAKHWPNVPRFEDVRTVTRESFAGIGGLDLIAGGFPCVDISRAGEQEGIDAERSGLWKQFYRLIREIRPRCVLVENVSALLERGMGRVLGDLASIGYDAEWDCLPACAFGARHIRDRVFIVASPSSLANTHCFNQGGASGQPPAVERWRRLAPISDCSHGTSWAIEPGMDRVAYGISSSMDRNCKLGNAVVPQIAEWIGRRIMESVK